MSETDIYLVALNIARQIATECSDKKDADKLLAILGELVCVRSFSLPQKQS